MLRIVGSTLTRLLSNVRRFSFLPGALELAEKELFGNPQEARLALQGLKAGWGIKQMEEALGPDGMVLLVRQQNQDSKHVLAHQWRGNGEPNIATIYDEAMQAYLQIRRSLPLPHLVGAGRAAPRVHFRLDNGETVIFPFVTFRHLAGPHTPLYYYQMPHLVVAKWPRALSFAPEQYMHPAMFRIDERWVLGGVPSRFVVFNGNASEVSSAINTCGSIEGFLQSLRTFVG